MEDSAIAMIAFELLTLLSEMTPTESKEMLLRP
jgi:hypothetical protein